MYAMGVNVYAVEMFLRFNGNIIRNISESFLRIILTNFSAISGFSIRVENKKLSIRLRSDRGLIERLTSSDIIGKF